MKSPGRWTIYILAMLLTGCFHKHPEPAPQQVAPELAQTPPPAAPVTTTQVTTPQQPAPAPPAVADQTVAPPPATEEPETHHRKRHVEKAPTEVAATPETPAAEAIGQLSTGSSGETAQQIINSITATENGLKQIRRALNEQEQKTAAQITEFLKQARAALSSGDTDGASTLAVKAKVLLSELAR